MSEKEEWYLCYTLNWYKEIYVLDWKDRQIAMLKCEKLKRNYVTEVISRKNIML